MDDLELPWPHGPQRRRIVTTPRTLRLLRSQDRPARAAPAFGARGPTVRPAVDLGLAAPTD